jgi:predicted amidohydrolase YtcJ
MGYCPLACRSAVIWSDDFNDGNYDGWTIYENSSNWSAANYYLQLDQDGLENGITPIVTAQDGVDWTPMLLSSQGFCVKAADLPPDIIFHNGVILTMEHFPVQVEALAIQGESILAIGNESDILAMAGPNTLLIDLEGRPLLPGFIDSHAHHIVSGLIRDPPTPDAAIKSVLSSGWTSISEMVVDQGILDELITLDQEDRLRVRVNAYLMLSSEFGKHQDFYQAYQPGQEFSSKLRIGGLKIVMDSWPDWVLNLNQTELDALVQEAHEAGFQIAIHSLGDAATDMVLNSYESALGGESNELYRHRIEHLILLTDDQIQRMSNLGIIASIQIPWFNSDWTQLEEYPILQDRSHLVGRFRDILQAGIPSLGSSDFPSWGIQGIPVASSPIQTISMAVTRIGELGLSPTDWMLNQTISVEQALQLLTIDAAYGTFQEDIKGSIKVGKLADLVILSDNPLTVSEDSLADIEVLLTMVGGKIEYTREGSGLPEPLPRPLRWYEIIPPPLVFISFLFLTIFAFVAYFEKKGVHLSNNLT